MRAFIAAGVAALVLASCSKPKPPEPPPPTVDLDASTLTADPASAVRADGDTKATLTVTLVDTEGNPVQDAVVTLSATGEGVSLVQPAAPTDVTGVAKGSISATRPGVTIVTARALWQQEPYEIKAQARVEFVPGPAAKLAFSVPPSTAQAGSALAPAVQVAVQDALGNTVFDATTEITLTLGENADGASLAGTTTVAAEAGVATFSDLVIEKAGSGYTLIASGAGLTSATSEAFDITVGAPAHLAFLVAPSNVSAGTVIDPPLQVAIQDPLGNLVPTATDVISLALGENPGQATMSGTLSVRAAGGIATFTDLKIDKAGAGYTLAATSRLLEGTTSESFDVTATGATRLVFVAQPSNAAAGQPIAPAVQVAVQDDFGNVIAGTQTVTLALGAAPTGTQLGGTLSVAAVDGVATFSDLTLESAATGYTLTASSDGLAGATSSAFDVAPGEPYRLVFQVEPSNAAAGSAISPPVEVAVHDRFGNKVTSSRPQVTVALGDNPDNATLAGTLTLTAFNGAARFLDLRVEQTGAGYTLVASATGLESATSAPFDVTAGAATQLAFLMEPTSSAAGASIPVEIELRDRFGNRATSATDSVTIELGANPAGGTLLGSASVNAVAGVATFSTLNITKAGAGYTFVASSGRLPTVTSATFDITAAAPAKLTYVQQPSNAVAAAPIAPPVTIAVLDTYGNPVPTAGDAVTLALRNGTAGAALSGTKTVSAVDGLATFADLRVDKVGSGYTLLATASGRIGAESDPFAVAVGAPATLAFRVQPRLSTVNTSLAPALEVTVSDAGGNLVPTPHPITLALGNNPSSATLGGTKTVNSASGIATFADLTVSQPGQGYTLVASGAGATEATSAAFNVQVGGPARLAFSAQPTNAVAGVAIAPAVEVSVLDTWGNVVPSATQPVSIAVGTGPGTVRGTLTATPVNGVARFSDLILERVGTYTLLASSQGLTDGTSVAFTIAVAPPSASVSTVAVNPAAGVVADGTALSTITVTVLDAFGNPVPGASVGLTSSGSGNTLTAPAVTNSSGVTSATLKSTKAEEKVLTATVGGSLTLDAHPTITFVAGAPSTTLSTVAVSPASGVTADGGAVSTITVTVLDAKSNPVPGATVALSATGSNNTLSTPPATDPNGVSVATIASTKAETKAITATINGSIVLGQKPNVVFVAGPPSPTVSTVTVNPATGVIANNTALSTITVTVKDATGNLVPGVTVTLAASGSIDAAGTSNTLVQPAAVTTAAGVATGTIKSTLAEVKTISATAGGVALDAHPTITFVPGAVSASVSTAAASPSSLVADGSALSTITVTALDAFSNPIEGAAVTLTSTGANNTISIPAFTDANGVTTATFSSTKAEVKEVTVKVGTVTLGLKPRITFVPGAPSASTSTLTASAATAVANGTATVTLTATIKDAQGNPVPGATVVLASSGTGDTLTQPAVTNASGVATGTIASTKAEAKTLTATVGSVALEATATVTFVPGPVSPTASSVVASPTTVSANGVAATTITVTALDAYSNAISGAAVTVTVSGTNNTFALPANTGTDGTTTTTLTSTKAETKTITAKIGTATLSSPATVTFVASSVDETRSTLAVSPATGVVANGTAYSTVTATVRDTNGNPVSGRTVTLSSTGSSNTLAPTSGVSDVNGVVTATLTSTKAEVKTLSAVVDSLTIAQHPTVTFVAGPASASESSVSVAPPTVVADNTTTAAISVTVRDAFGNPVPGIKPALSATGSNNTFTQPNNTDANGVATGTLKSSKAEQKTITATLPTTPGLVLDQKPVVTFIAGQVVAGSSVTVGPATGIVADGVATSTITVTLKDAANNPVPGVTVSFAVTGTGNVPIPDTTSNTSGVATAALASTVAELKTVTVTANGVVLTTKPSVTFVAGAPFQANCAVTASPSTVTADGVATTALVVSVRDAFNNPVPGATVKLLATGSLNKFTPASGATTTAGVFGSTLASKEAGEKRVLATIAGFEVSTSVTFGYTPPQIKSLTLAAGGGCVAVNYAVQQSQAQRVDVLVEYDPTGSGPFLRATQAGSTTAHGVHGVTSLAAVGGQGHTFLWNTTADLPRTAVSNGRLRLTPYVAGVPGTAMTTTIGALTNALTFNMASAVASGTRPVAVVEGDFNADGKLDLVTSNPDDDKIYVLLGNGTGGFTAAKPFPAQQSAAPAPAELGAMAAGDLDGDGDLDLAVGTATGEVMLFLNDGAGNFPLPPKGADPEPPPRPSFTVASAPSAIVAADLQSDGLLDLAVVSTSGATVLRNVGNSGYAGWPEFLTASTYPAGSNPSALAVGDVNSDGRPDLLVANSDSDSVSVLLNAGTTFNPATSLAAGAGPSAIATADLNADGALDLVVANRTANSLSVFLGVGNGTFTTGGTRPTGIGPASVASADVDGDGKLDIVVANEIENTLGVHLGNGDGTFSSSVKPVASGQPGALVIGDFNRDGKPDLAAAASVGNVVDVLISARPRRCDPGLATATNAPLGTSPQAIASGDFNGDGKPDVAVIDGFDGNFKVLLGTGNGGYRAPLSTTIPGGGGGYFLAADMNADGKLDIVTPADTGANYFSGSGTGTFSAPVATAGGAFPAGLAAGDFNGDDKLDLVAAVETNSMISIFPMAGTGFGAPTHIAIGGQPQSAVTGDFDRDGKVDLAVVNLSRLSVLRGNGDGTFGAPVEYSAGTAPRFVLAADLDADGALDIAVADRDGTAVQVLKGNGDATFVPAVGYAAATGQRWLSVDDLDGDGNLDLLVGFGSGHTAMVLPGAGNGTFGAARTLDFAATPVAVASADFDADGAKDVAAVVQSASPRLTTLLGQGDGTFPMPAVHTVGAGASAVCSADFDGDGALDLAVSAQTANQASLLFGDGLGGLAAGTPATVTAPGASTRADLDGDGDLDLLVASGSQGRLFVMLNNGDGTFAAPVGYLFPGSSPTPYALATGDFDRDGKLDVVVANGTGNNVCFFMGQAGGTLQQPTLTDGCIVVGDGPRSIAVADFDRNGALDVAVAVVGVDAAGLLLGLGDGNFAPLRSFAVGQAPVAIVAADLNGDGKADLVTGNSANDSLSVLLGLGTGYFQTPTTVPAYGEPIDLFAADVDDDGKTDLVAAILGNGLAVFSGNGSGGLSTPVAWYLDADAYSMGDFDRDGRLDFAFVSTDASSAGVCIGR